jgi:hypothetical protein
MTTTERQSVFPLFCALLAFSGCARDNVTGRAPAAGETFTGLSAGPIGGGALALQSSKGTKCEGRTWGAESIGSSVAVITLR